MENPGSLNDSLERYPELPRQEVIRMWEGELLKWQIFVSANVISEMVELDGKTCGNSPE